MGSDGAGVIEAVASDVSGFSTGDEVYYAGSPIRHGSNAECKCRRIVSLRDQLHLHCPCYRVYRAIFVNHGMRW